MGGVAFLMFPIQDTDYQEFYTLCLLQKFTEWSALATSNSWHGLVPGHTLQLPAWYSFYLVFKKVEVLNRFVPYISACCVDAQLMLSRVIQ